MAASSAVRFVAGTKKSPLGTLYLQCHVKPGANKQREGVNAVTDDAIELCVAAQAREGEANKAVIDVLSEVILPTCFRAFSSIAVSCLRLSLSSGSSADGWSRYSICPSQISASSRE